MREPGVPETDGGRGQGVREVPVYAEAQRGVRRSGAGRHERTAVRTSVPVPLPAAAAPFGPAPAFRSRSRADPVGSPFVNGTYIAIGTLRIRSPARR
jgi:hypothetical protein